MQHETGVARPPLITDLWVFIDDEIGHAQIRRVRPKRETALTAAHNEDKGNL
jgi:hypothetical protein